ncbi:hypothetical protein NQ315_005055 [Exocentrus adspersus]|uniref:Transposase n=1 Tax=Exocentrus adspersus TaxID=1586481 RepID=A0AAV8VQ57_9CUCU|nr:hypothetical protein NQ315_005055 [Exocentrus adspersus]
MPLYLQESLRIEVLMMIGYGEQVRGQAEVAVLFSENHPELPPISQDLCTDLGHVRDVKRQRQPRINEKDKLNVLLEYQEHSVSPARKVAREHGVSHTTVRKWLKEAKMHPYKIQLVHELNENDPDRRVEYSLVVLFPNEVDDDLMDERLWFQQDGAPPHFALINRPVEN